MTHRRLSGSTTPLLPLAVASSRRPARVRVVVYVTRVVDGCVQLLVFDHRDVPAAGTQVPAGGVHAGERVDAAARREVVEETGVDGVRVLGVLGVQQHPHPDTGEPRVSVVLHAETGHTTDSWVHTVAGDPRDGDSGLVFARRFTSLREARTQLADSQGEFLHLLGDG